MTDPKEICPNFGGCKIVVDHEFQLDHPKRIQYIQNYCQNGISAWSRCKRYIVRETWHICPDFVMPDTVQSADEIIDLLGEELKN